MHAGLNVKAMTTVPEPESVPIPGATRIVIDRSTPTSEGSSEKMMPYYSVSRLLIEKMSLPPSIERYRNLQESCSALKIPSPKVLIEVNVTTYSVPSATVLVNGLA